MPRGSKDHALNGFWSQKPQYRVLGPSGSQTQGGTILYSTLLYSTLLNYTPLYSILLYSILFYSTILYYTILNSIILYFTLLYYIILSYTLLYYAILNNTVLYCIIPHLSMKGICREALHELLGAPGCDFHGRPQLPARWGIETEKQ